MCQKYSYSEIPRSIFWGLVLRLQLLHLWLAVVLKWFSWKPRNVIKPIMHFLCVPYGTDGYVNDLVEHFRLRKPCTTFSSEPLLLFACYFCPWSYTSTDRGCQEADQLHKYYRNFSGQRLCWGTKRKSPFTECLVSGIVLRTFCCGLSQLFWCLLLYYYHGGVYFPVARVCVSFIAF